MHSPEQIAREVLQAALSHEPDVRLIANVMACELAALAARQIATCTKCGAEAWVNIDCDLCLIAGQLTRGKVP
jgi:hypothetical protein